MIGWTTHSTKALSGGILCGCSLLLLAFGSGCSRNPYAAPGGYWGAPYAAQYPGAGMPGAGMPGAGMAPGYAPAQVTELERRIQQLDMDNRQLTTQLAQSQQRWQVSDQRANLFQQQLQDATLQLQQARLAQQDLQGQARGLQASMQARGGATLKPNTSGAPGTLPGLVGGNTGVWGSPQTNAPGPMPSNMQGGIAGQQQLGSLASGGSLPSAQFANIQVPGATVQIDGQTVRIRVPADQLFSPGTGQLNPMAYQVLDNVATAVFRYFPRQRVAIEAHTDSSNVTSGAFATPYQLATVQAQAVMDQLVRRNTLPTRQLAVVAHGPNFPRADNQSAAGRAENRRIEFVVYPEMF